jgi:chitinase
VKFGPAPAAGLPAKIVGAYQRDDTNFRITRPEMAHYNMIYYAFGKSAAAGTGRLTVSAANYPGGAAQLKADIATVKARGGYVLLSVGGSSDNGITVQNDTQVAEFVSSMKQYVADYGFNGMDWDLENGGVNTSVYGLSQASGILKRDLGANFAVGTAPAAFTAVYEQFCRLSSVAGIYNNRPCDFFGPQFYDYSNSDSGRIDGIVNYITNSINSGIPADNILIGTTYENGSYLGAAGGMYPQKYLDAYNILQSQGKNVRGAYIWSTASPESDHGWLFVNTFAPALGT